ncbi:DAGKc domain-containing protein [Mycena indigotica]|uniref:DAGKc domain-containing protein n=1 Tax=Mycena indigotica TaxID=2126181 RepID=A0A8H6S9M7_9AGAR|nr:DAGKc domain-containing protein [Mycena indigotica]KAF7294907.1 DAGKc domain-containing protein [Mycena indigotica]
MLMIRLRLQTRNGTFTSLSYADDQLRIQNARTLSLPLRQVITAKRTGRSLQLSYIIKNKSMSLQQLSGTVEEVADDVLDAWIDTLLHMAYDDVGAKRGRRLKVVVNPHGGTKKAVGIFNKTIEPILRAAECSLDVIQTTRRGHAYDIAKTLTLSDYDAIVVVSGDGLIHEILNGLANHEHPIKALSIPLAPIPTGTGNGLSLNLLGFEDGFDVCAAALNVVKGLPMKIDLLSVVQNGKRTISFMSQAMGLMADADIGTEHLRWMGEARFTYGLLRGLLRFKPCPIQLSYKAFETDKDKMYESLQKRKTNPSSTTPTTDAESTQLPELKYVSNDDDWTVVEEPLLYVLAGKGPYIGRDYMSFPVSVPDDGLMDIVLQTMAVSRGQIITNIGGAAKGEVYWHPSIRYVKAHAYRVKPLSKNGALAVDGEIFPFEEFQVETHPKLGNLLSLYGSYVADFAQKKTCNKAS